jgi:hypothetical protein
MIHSLNDHYSKHAQFAESAKLEQAIKANLRGLGYELHPTNQSP